MDTLRFRVFAGFMDFVVFPIAWVLSPRLREHLRYVRMQNAHLDGLHRGARNSDCAMCKEGY